MKPEHKPIYMTYYNKHGKRDNWPPEIEAEYKDKIAGGMKDSKKSSTSSTRSDDDMLSLVAEFIEMIWSEGVGMFVLWRVHVIKRDPRMTEDHRAMFSIIMDDFRNRVTRDATHLKDASLDAARALRDELPEVYDYMVKILSIMGMGVLMYGKEFGRAANEASAAWTTYVQDHPLLPAPAPTPAVPEISPVATVTQTPPEVAHGIYSP